MSPFDDQVLKLREVALEVQGRAHAPYSNFHVGAAILTDRGVVVGGCNVENASYGLTICAERNAIGQIVATGAGRPILCVVVGPRPEALTPCGACRQVLLEFNPAMRVVCFGTDGSWKDLTIGELLPHSFGVDSLTAGQ